MTDDLTDLEALAQAATPGPWRVESGEIRAGKYDDVVTPGPVSCMAYCHGGSSSIEWEPTDAAFIAAARDAVPALIARVRKAEAALARVEALAEEWDTEARGLIDHATTGRDVNEGCARQACADDLRATLPGGDDRG